VKKIYRFHRAKSLRAVLRMTVVSVVDVCWEMWKQVLHLSMWWRCEDRRKMWGNVDKVAYVFAVPHADECGV
jgi:hypothetical protein